MRFAEVFLRLGCALVAWMVTYAYFIWLAVAGRVGCGPDGDEMFRLLLGMAPISVLCAFLLGSTRTLQDVHRILRWLALPLVPVLPFATYTIGMVFGRVAINENAICAESPSAVWVQWWAPVQSASLAFVCIMLIRVWMLAREPADE